MSNAPAFLYSSVLSGFTNELNAQRISITTVNGDAGTATECDCVGVSMPNASGNILVYSSTDNVTFTLRATVGVSQLRNSMGFFDAVTARYWRVVASGFSTVAVVKLGKAVRMAQNNYGGVAPTAFHQSVNMTPQNLTMGQWLGRQAYGRAGGMSYRFDKITAAWIRSNALTMISALREGAGVFYAWRPEKYPQDVIYGHLNAEVRLQNDGTLSFMSGEINIDGVYDANYNQLNTYAVTAPT